MTPIACIYHKNCIDGTTAAAVVLRRYPDTQCFPVGHTHTDEELAEILPQIAPSAHVYIVDTVHGAEAAVTRGHQVTVLDHHVSEHDRMTAYAATAENLTYVFDASRSGASLTWSYLFESEPMPRLIEHVEDIDLWLNRYGDLTEHAASYLSLLRNDPAAVAALFSQDIEEIYERGSILTQNMHMEIERLLKLEPLMLTIGEHRVPAFNITSYQSHCGNELSRARDEAVAMYTIRGDITRFSLRSRDGQVPSALELAEHLGGGGHRNAAGATMATADFIRNLDI